LSYSVKLSGGKKMLTLSRRALVAGLGCAALSVVSGRPGYAQIARLRAAGVVSDVFGEPFFAREAGAFTRAGFDLDVVNMNNAGAIVAAIGGGSLDIGLGDLVSGVNAINAGVPITLIAAAGLYKSSETTLIIAVPKDSTIRKAADLAGKTICVPTLVGLTTASLRAWLPAHGVDLSSVKIVELPQSATAAALDRHTVDAGLLSEPFIVQNKAAIRDVGHPLDAIGNEFAISVWYASRAWVDADRGRARRVVTAIYETAAWCNRHREETMSIMATQGGMDVEKVHGMVRTTFATSLSPAALQPVLDLATRAKIFDRSIDANAIIARLT
jgi:NitT/TauT family transport system substrate-binding protein